MPTQEENYGSIFMALDKLFLTVFIMEILIKWYHDFFGFWKVNWNIFDFTIVTATLLGPSKLIGNGTLLIMYGLLLCKQILSVHMHLGLT